MRVTRSTGQIVIRDRPGPLWTLGLFLLAGAVLAVLMPLGLATNSDELELWQRVASIAIGLGGGAGTLWLLAANPASRVQLDLGHRQIRIARVSLLGRSERGLAFDDIESVHMQEGADSDGDPIWRPAIRLRSREDVMLSELWSHDRPGVENSLSAVADACGVPVREVVGVG